MSQTRSIPASTKSAAAEVTDNRTKLRRLTWPLPWRWVAWPFLVIFAATAWQMRQMLDWAYIDWPALSGLPLAAVGLVGPMAAAAAGFVSSSTWHPRSPLASPIAIRSGPATLRAQLRVVLPMWLAAFTAGFTPFLVLGGTRATGHSPDLVHIGFALVSFSFFLVAGYALGALLPVQLAPLIAFAGGYGLVFVSAYIPATFSNPWRVLLPVLSSEARIGTVTVAGSWMLKTLFVAAVMVVAAWLAGRRPTVRHACQDLLVIAVPVVLLVGLAGTLVASSVSLYTRGQDVSAVCTNAPGVRVCVDEGQLTALPAAADAVESVLRTVGGPPDQLLAASDRVLDPQRQAQPVGVPIPPPELDASPSTAWFGLSPNQPIADSVQRTLADYLSGTAACSTVSDLGITTEPGMQRAGQLAQYIRATSSPATDSSGETDIAAWYQREQDAILMCEAPPLPPEMTDAGSGG